MARASKSVAKKSGNRPSARTPLRRRLRRLAFRCILGAVGAGLLLVLLGTVFNPPTTAYIFSEGRRLGGVKQTWVPLEQIAPAMARSAVAAEDANFCQHWGFDIVAIKKAIAQGGTRGASTISQQTVKNVYLWHGRTWLRKAMEAVLTPVVESIWSKRRIVEVYLNVAEFDEGVFGVEAAAQHYFGVSAADLSDVQAARLAAILPAPKDRSASKPSDFVQKRTRQVRDGAATIRRDGRAACFES